jgi:photosystem II PsbM protein
MYRRVACLAACLGALLLYTRPREVVYFQPGLAPAVAPRAQAFMSAGDPMPFAAVNPNMVTGMPDMAALKVNTMEQLTTTLGGVVAVDGGTIGLDVSFGAFLAVILGLFIPVVFLVTLFIQSDAQGTATTFRQPDSIGGTPFEDE